MNISRSRASSAPFARRIAGIGPWPAIPVVARIGGNLGAPEHKVWQVMVPEPRRNKSRYRTFDADVAAHTRAQFSRCHCPPMRGGCPTRDVLQTGRTFYWDKNLRGIETCFDSKHQALDNHRPRRAAPLGHGPRESSRQLDSLTGLRPVTATYGPPLVSPVGIC